MFDELTINKGFDRFTDLRLIELNAQGRYYSGKTGNAHQGDNEKTKESIHNREAGVELCMDAEDGTHQADDAHTLARLIFRERINRLIEEWVPRTFR